MKDLIKTIVAVALVVFAIGSVIVLKTEDDGSSVAGAASVSEQNLVDVDAGTGFSGIGTLPN